jgi:dTDP-4-dehydrorhamnose 3,5-epimerase
MLIHETALPEVLLLEPRVFGDERGWFMETYRAAADGHGQLPPFVQDNHSLSHRGVLRGLHYQIEHAQGKLVRVVHGAAFDVAVDLRRWSHSFGQWFGTRLSAENHRQLYVPPGFAHGFLALEDATELVYKCTDYYHPEAERTLLWNDPQLGIQWPLTEEPLVSWKDRQGKLLREAEHYESRPDRTLRLDPSGGLPGNHRHAEGEAQRAAFESNAADR